MGVGEQVGADAPPRILAKLRALAGARGELRAAIPPRVTVHPRGGAGTGAVAAPRPPEPPGQPPRYPAAARPAGRVHRRRAARALLLGAAAIALFRAYLHMAYAWPASADAASQSLQAWDLLHGNVLLRGWTMSDVSFYTTEILQHALLELLIGYNAHVVHVAAAMTYTMLVLLVAVLAKGRARGTEAVVRMAVAVAIMLAPSPGIQHMIVLSSPNHTGTGVPLLVTWIVLDRALARRDTGPRWLPATIAVLLAWGAIGDPLVTFVGALPLAVVSAYRVVRAGTPGSRRWRSLDAKLGAAAVASVVVSHAVVAAIRLAGGFHVHSVALQFAPLSQLIDRVGRVIANVGVVFGAYLPDERHVETGLPPEWTPVAVALGGFHVLALAAVVLAVCRVLVRAVRRPSASAGDRVSEILAVAIVVNIGAYLVSTLPTDGGGAREIIAVLPLGAVLVGRVLAPRVAARRLLPAVAAVLTALSCAVVVQPPNRVPVAQNQDVADYLVAHHLTYGLGTYWTSNNITLTTGGRVTVAPLTPLPPIMAYRWESRADWYDPAHHDARFVVVHMRDDPEGLLAAVTARFGVPAEQQIFDMSVVMVYDHNLLADLPALCHPGTAPSMAECA